MNNVKLAISCGILFASLNSNAANMASWVSNNTVDQSENKQNTGSKPKKSLGGFFGNEAPNDEEQDISGNIGQSNEPIKQNLEFEKRPESQLMLSQREKLKEITESQKTTETEEIASTQNENLNSISSSSQYTKATDNKKQASVLPAASDNEILHEQKKMEAFIMKAQSFVSSNMLNSLTPDQSIAISLLNAALMQVGVEEMSGMSSSSNQAAYNQAIGCINSFAHPGLNSTSNALISKYMSVVNISPVVNVGPKVGSSFKAKCY